jgi:hypothetical protein
MLEMKYLVIKLVFSLFFFIFANDSSISLLASPRVMFALLIAFWLLLEWRVEQMRAWIVCILTGISDAQGSGSINRIVKENFELSRTVFNLSEQHTLLCEIRNNVSKTHRCAKDTLVELRLPLLQRTYVGFSQTESSNTPSPPSGSSQSQTKPPLMKSNSFCSRSKAKDAFRRGESE